MSLRPYLITLLVVSLLCGGGWVWLLLNKDPVYANTLIIVSFYFNLGGFLFSTFTLSFFFIRRRHSNNSSYYSNFLRALRRSAFLTSYVLIFFSLNAQRLGTWYDYLLLGVALTLFELYFHARYPEKPLVTTNQTNREEVSEHHSSPSPDAERNDEPPSIKHVA